MLRKKNYESVSCAAAHTEMEKSNTLLFHCSQSYGQMFSRSRSGVEYVKKSWIIFVSLDIRFSFNYLMPHFGVLLWLHNKRIMWEKKKNKRVINFTFYWRILSCASLENWILALNKKVREYTYNPFIINVVAWLVINTFGILLICRKLNNFLISLTGRETTLNTENNYESIDLCSRHFFFAHAAHDYSCSYYSFYFNFFSNSMNSFTDYWKITIMPIQSC